MAANRIGITLGGLFPVHRSSLQVPIRKVDRQLRHEGRSFLLEYVLLMEATVGGKILYWIRCYEQVLHRGNLVHEDAALAGPISSNEVRACMLFDKIAEAESPVFPDHLVDIVRELTLEREFARRPSHSKGARASIDEAAMD